MQGTISLSHTTPSLQAAASSSNLDASQPKVCNVGRSWHSTNLQWARRDGMGAFRSSLENRRMVLSRSKMGVREKSCGVIPVTAEFTSKQEALVKDTWAVLKKDAGQHALALFLRVFEIAPAAKKLFSFLKDSNVPLEKNPKLKAHALQVFVIICEAATSLTKKGQVSTPGSTMKDMAHSHVISGVVDEHYDVVRYCLLKTVEAGLPAEMWTDEVKNAWGDAYDELVLAIKAQEEYLVPS